MEEGRAAFLPPSVVPPLADRKDGRRSRRQWDIRKTPTRSFVPSFLRRICNFVRSLGTLTIKRRAGGREGAGESFARSGFLPRRRHRRRRTQKKKRRRDERKCICGGGGGECLSLPLRGDGRQ